MQAMSSAHATALGRDADELGWALPAAVADTLEHLADTSPVSDPVALVATARARATRRRRTRAGAFVAAAVLTVVVAAAVALAWPNPVPGIAAPTLPPEAPQWSAISSWAPRGNLVGDPAVTALAAARAGDPDARLLFAGTVGDTTVVLMTGTPTQTQPAVVLDPRVVPGPDIAPLHLSLWTAPAHRGPAALAPTRIEGDDSARSSDVVALSIEQDAAGAPPVVLVLTRPTVTEGFARTGARPDPDGRIRTLVQSLTLTGGVAMFTQNPGYPTTIAVAGFTGPPAGVVTDDDRLPERGSADDLATAQRTLLAAVAGYPVGALDTPAARDAVVDIPNPDAGILGADPGDVHVTIVSTVTADGGWVRTSRLSATSEDSGGQNMELLAAVPASDHSHALLPVGDMRRPTFVALAPDAATAQLVTTDGHLRDSATVKDGLAILTSTQDPITATFRLRLLAPDGHTVYDDVPDRTGTAAARPDHRRDRPRKRSRISRLANRVRIAASDSQTPTMYSESSPTAQWWQLPRRPTGIHDRSMGAVIGAGQRLHVPAEPCDHERRHARCCASRAPRDWCAVRGVGPVGDVEVADPATVDELVPDPSRAHERP